MAQRMIHYLIGTRLLEKEDCGDRMRFLLGSVLPDAYRSRKERDASHFVRRTDSGMVFYDAGGFFDAYRDRIPSDGLYLGYYMHLVEDVFYRTFIRKDKKLEIFGIPDAVRILHNDYRLLNRYIIETYGLRNEIVMPADLLQEPVLQCADFACEEFLKEFEGDFCVMGEGNTVYITGEMLEEFLAAYYPLIEQEYLRVLHGQGKMNAQKYAWKRTGE